MTLSAQHDPRRKKFDLPDKTGECFDKKRTVPLLRLAGLTITSQQLLQNGSVGSITYKGQNVKIDGVPFSEVVSGDGEVQKKKVLSAASFSAKTHSEVFAPKPSVNSIPAEGGDVNRKFSLKGMDSAYMEAVERGDTGTAQKGKCLKPLQTKEKPGKRCVSSVFLLAQWEGFEPSCRF